MAIVHAKAMKMQARPSHRFVRLARLRKLCEYEQVAAVCYRVRGGTVEFLLIQTRSSGRWTFPKGSAERGLTHAQAAALEAFEEAGVHGRIEEAPFARYVRRKQGQKDSAVSAHLCEVSRLGPGQEAKRNRTWFAAEKARERLREGRQGPVAAQFARVVDKALERIELLHGGIREAHGLRGVQLRSEQVEKDGLQRVQFEALTTSPLWGVKTSLSSTRIVQGRVASAEAAQACAQVLPCEVLEFNSVREPDRTPRWLAGAKKAKGLGAAAKNG